MKGKNNEFDDRIVDLLRQAEHEQDEPTGERTNKHPFFLLILLLLALLILFFQTVTISIGQKPSSSNNIVFYKVPNAPVLQPASYTNEEFDLVGLCPFQ